MKAIRRMSALALLVSAASFAAAQPASNPLANEAKITEAQARATALARVPGGNVKAYELETEKGRLIWTFDIAAPRTAGVTEVHVDAKTGKLVAVQKETAAAEAKEAKEGD